MTRRFFILLLTVVIGCGQAAVSLQNQGKGKGPKPPPEPPKMALRFFDSFARATDTASGSFYPWSTMETTVTSPLRHGGRTLDASVSPVNGEVQTFDFSISTAAGASNYNITDTYLSFYLRFDAIPNGNDTIVVFWSATPDIKGELRFDINTGKLQMRDQNSIIGTSSTALSVDTWYRIDVMIGTGTSANWEVRVHQDGSPGTSVEMSGTDNFLTSTMDYVIFDCSSLRDHYISHVTINDSGYVANGSDYRIETLFPNGNGNYTAWTGSYTDVDDVKHDATTTEITTSTNLDRETVTLENLPTLSAGESVLAVMNIYHMRKTSNAATDVQVIDRLGGTDRDSSSFGLAKNDGGDDDQKWFVIYDTKPGGGSWTESDVNGYEIGLEHNQAQVREIFCTAMNANVLIEMPGAASAGKAGRMTLLGVQ